MTVAFGCSDLDLPFSRWDSDRIALWLHVIGLSAYVGNCKRWGRNGEQLLQATTNELEKVFMNEALLISHFLASHVKLLSHFHHHRYHYYFCVAWSTVS